MENKAGKGSRRCVCVWRGVVEIIDKVPREMRSGRQWGHTWQTWSPRKTWVFTGWDGGPLAGSEQGREMTWQML